MIEKPTLRDPITWELRLVHDRALHGMDHRAIEEEQNVIQGLQIEEVHEQAVRDFGIMSRMINGARLFLRLAGLPAKGNAVDMGSGTGVGAAILSKWETIQEVYALEMSREFVDRIMPIVFKKYRAETEKIQRVVGDFNLLDVPDGSLGVVLDIDSFHHSEDLDLTFRECYRAMAPGAAIISVDRAWPDSLTQNELDAKLDRELNENLKRKYNVPEGQSFTRRDFGEHEYTVKQWLEAYKRNGFDAVAFRQWHPRLLNRFFLKLPTFHFSVWISVILYGIGLRRLWLYGFSKTRTLFVAIKRPD